MLTFGVFYFFYFGILGIYLPYFNLYCKDLGFTSAQIGFVSAIHPFARLAFPVLWAIGADHFGKRHFFVRWAWFLSMMTFLVLFFANSFTSVLWVLIIYAFFMVPVLPLWEATTLEWVHKSKSNYGAIRLWGSLGFIAFSLCFGQLLDQYSNRLVLYGVGVLSFFNFLLLVRIKDEAEIEKQRLSDLIRFLAQIDLWIFLGCLTLMVFSHGTFYGFFSIYMRELGYSKTLIGMLWTTGVICEIGLMLLTGKMKNVHWLLYVLPLCFLAAMLRWWINAKFVLVWMLFLSQALHGLTFGSFHVASVRLIHRIFPPFMRSSGQSLYSSFSFGLGGVLGLIINGWYYDSLGPRKLFEINCWVAFFGLLLTCLLIYRNRTSCLIR
ncbi:MAG: MFS transporter [Chlamydiota bacterium]|nr:MFS transporter [Chlamydiota bacterium]